MSLSFFPASKVLVVDLDGPFHNAYLYLLFSPPSHYHLSHSPAHLVGSDFVNNKCVFCVTA